MIRPLPPNSTIVRFPNRRPFPNTNGVATYAPPYDNPEGPYSNPGGPYSNPEGPYATSGTPYLPPYSTPSPTNHAEGRNFPLNPSSSTNSNNRVKSKDQDLDDDIKGRGTLTNTVNFVPEIRMLDKEDFLSEVKIQLDLRHVDNLYYVLVCHLNRHGDLYYVHECGNKTHLRTTSTMYV